MPEIYVSLKPGFKASKEIEQKVIQAIDTAIGKIARPKHVWIVPDMPKTRSGKIMRRILRKIAEDDPSNLGDTSTLADPAVVDDLVANRQNRRL
jgi:acetyl-CoA synthetase